MSETFPQECLDELDDEEYRETYFLSQVSSADRPLVVQFGGNDAPTLVAAALLAQPHCDAVDLNLGCPQKRACEGLYGAYLADREHWRLTGRLNSERRLAALHMHLIEDER